MQGWVCGRERRGQSPPWHQQLVETEYPSPSGGETTFPDPSNFRVGKGIRPPGPSPPGSLICCKKSVSEPELEPGALDSPSSAPSTMPSPICPSLSGWSRHSPRQHLPLWSDVCFSHGVMSGFYLNEPAWGGQNYDPGEMRMPCERRCTYPTP